MATKQKSRKARKAKTFLGKPRGIIHPRVQAVGPDKFAIVAADCAKGRSKLMVVDFYGKVLMEPIPVLHNRGELNLAVTQVRQVLEKHKIADHIVAIEMTGTYHRPLQQVFRKSGNDTRLVHPFATVHFRAPANEDLKTDETDLQAIARAAINGFGLEQLPVGEDFQRLQILVRHRRTLVKKRAKLQCQIRELLDRCMPGYAALFPDDDLWTSTVAMFVAQRVKTPNEILEAGVKGITRWLHDSKVRFFARTVERIVAWAGNAADSDPLAPQLFRVWREHYEDWLLKTKQITQLEIESAEILVKMPYILLLSIPGINIVSASEAAGELGPIQNYASHRAITGRAGLFPSRYQSENVDFNGRLAHQRNARLRAALLLIADNLIKCNSHFRGKSELWKQRGFDARDIRCRIGNRAARTIFQMVSGRQLYHPCGKIERQYVLDKVLTFHQEHDTSPDQILRDMHEAAKWIPKHEQASECKPLRRRYEKSARSRSKGPQQIASIVLAVLARYGINQVESQDEAQGPIADQSVTATDNVIVSRG